MTDGANTTLDGKGVLVTGGSTGIGRAIAIALAGQGAKIYTFARDEKNLADGLKAIAGAGEVYGHIADQAVHEDLVDVFAKAQTSLGQLNAVIANAAVAAEGLADLSDPEWRYAMDINMSGYLDVAKQAVDAFGDNGGDIVLIGSISSDAGQKDTSVYAAAKAGLQGFVKSFRKEVAEKNIRVSLIEPGSVGSDMQEKSPAEQRKAIEKAKMLKAEDVAGLVSFILTRPPRCVIPQVRIEPLFQGDDD